MVGGRFTKGQVASEAEAEVKVKVKEGLIWSEGEEKVKVVRFGLNSAADRIPPRLPSDGRSPPPFDTRKESREDERV
ncbi:hypothetical protein MLD38_009208 [Melastoma candidum]|uniref:Uncharacterized protein n=1 Tax=Melastoma candidum TaxID=119954 RepID=A0ACB9RXC9_9MYRT|nr:hypothetical protein MLD38_009208 [Melastoma candidum]